MTVRELLARIDSAELSEWIAFDRVCPLPDGWTQTGVIASTMANLWTTGGRRYKPADFAPRRAQSAEQQSAHELALFDAMTANRVAPTDVSP
jgi:hypothetical protein